MKLDYLHLLPQQALPQLENRPFRAVIVADMTVDEGWRYEVARWLVCSGCLYVLARGVDCQAWHDDVDWDNLHAFDFKDIPDDRFVVTTWHSNEPLSEVFWFAGHCATHPTVESNETLIVHIADAARCSELLEAYHRSQVLGIGGVAGAYG